MIFNGWERVDVFVSAKKLPNLHMFDRTDPFAVIFHYDKSNSVMNKLGTTEMLMNNPDPVFATKTTIDYLFEEEQEIHVHIYHNTGRGPITEVSHHELVGEYRFPLSSLMRAPSQKLHGALFHGKKTSGCGEIEIRAEAQVSTRDVFVATFSGEKLSNKDGFFGTSDPFLEIHRLNEDGGWTPVWRNQHIDNTLNPKFPASAIPMATLCNGDIDRPLRVCVFDFDKGEKHQSMGYVETSVRGLISSGGAHLNVIEPDKKGKKGYVNSGTLKADHCMIEHHPTFTEFVMGGMEINLVVGIDYTGSNGDPRNPGTLHYVDPSHTTQNVYEQAITAVGRILEAYDTDKMVSVFGFGGRVKIEDGSFGPVNHCFPVEGPDKEVRGVDGILHAYHEFLHEVQFSGPTLFTPLIQQATMMTRTQDCSQINQKYTILLIITDGVINDMDATKEAIHHAAKEGLSIIIVGVGPADFIDMKELDGDKLKKGEKAPERDIVQFVQFTPSLTPTRLSKAVLAEIPNQVLQFMEMRKINPNPKKT